MSGPFSIFVPGTPVSKGSLSPVGHGRYTRLIEKRAAGPRKKLKAWREAVRTLVTNEWTTQRGAPIGVRRTRYLAPVRVELLFALARPKSAPKYRTWPTTYPDIDKLARVVLDELKAALEDDRQIVELIVTKVYDDESGVQIQIGEMPRILRRWERDV